MKTMIRLVTIAALSLAVYSCAISNDSDFLGHDFWDERNC